MHERKAIRDAAIALLVGKTDAGSRVNRSRQAPVRGAELPLISVYSDREVSDPSTFSSAPRKIKRTLTLVVEAWLSAADANADQLDDLFDAMALQIETALDADVDLDGSVFWFAGPAATEFGLYMEGNRPMGCVHLEFTAVYHSDLRTQIADDARDDLTSEDIQIKVTPTADPPSEDLITTP